MWDEQPPYVSSQVSDQNPDASSPSVASASGGGGWLPAANNVLDKLLAYHIATDKAAHAQTLNSQAASVRSPLVAPKSSAGSLVVAALALLVLGAGAVWAARQLKAA